MPASLRARSCPHAKLAHDWVILTAPSLAHNTIGAQAATNVAIPVMSGLYMS